MHFPVDLGSLPFYLRYMPEKKEHLLGLERKYLQLYNYLDVDGWILS